MKNDLTLTCYSFVIQVHILTFIVLVYVVIFVRGVYMAGGPPFRWFIITIKLFVFSRV